MCTYFDVLPIAAWRALWTSYDATAAASAPPECYRYYRSTICRLSRSLDDYTSIKVMNTLREAKDDAIIYQNMHYIGVVE